MKKPQKQYLILNPEIITNFNKINKNEKCFEFNPSTFYKHILFCSKKQYKQNGG